MQNGLAGIRQHHHTEITREVAAFPVRACGIDRENRTGPQAPDPWHGACIQKRFMVESDGCGSCQGPRESFWIAIRPAFVTRFRHSRIDQLG